MNIFTKIICILGIVVILITTSWIGLVKWQDTRNEAIRLRQEVRIQKIELNKIEANNEAESVRLHTTIELKELVITQYKDSVDAFRVTNRVLRKNARQLARQRRRDK